MSDERMEQYIRFTQIPGFGVISQNRLMTLCGDIDACFQMTPEEIYNCFRLSGGNIQAWKTRLDYFLHARESVSIKDAARRILEFSRDKGIQLFPSEDVRYPARFKRLPDMPVLLYAKGDLRINDYSHSVGIVGARRCSENGKEKAILTAEHETEKGTAVVSGMAKGIDAYAQTAVLKHGGYTAAVLGNGADICYPKEHERLYQEIVTNGCIISEYPPGTAPKPYLFPKRNRLIAALSDILYVIDAGERSGTHTTIESCRRYERPVIQF